MQNVFYKYFFIKGEYQMDDKLLKDIHKIQKEVHKVADDYYHIWKDEIFLTWKWWFSLGLSILPWLLWIKYRKKESTDRLLYSGFFVLLITSWLDFVGIQMGLWVYPVDVIPSIPSYIPYDVCILPVMVMFIIQYKPKISPYFKGILFGSFNAFIAEPLLEWFDLYISDGWTPWHSFPFYIAIYLIAHLISTRNRFVRIIHK